MRPEPTVPQDDARAMAGDIRPMADPYKRDQCGQHRHTRVPGLRPVPPSVFTLSVTMVRWVAGEGCCSDDPVRNVTSYYDAETGEHLWTDDQLENDGSDG